MIEKAKKNTLCDDDGRGLRTWRPAPWVTRAGNSQKERKRTYEQKKILMHEEKKREKERGDNPALLQAHVSPNYLECSV
jgi:hypothetical protein